MLFFSSCASADNAEHGGRAHIEFPPEHVGHQRVRDGGKPTGPCRAHRVEGPQIGILDMVGGRAAPRSSAGRMFPTASASGGRGGDR
jgi:hypothetical protein